MTSKGDSLKTNEFLRLRKLRLQQVREQSKDIAKKIRQRAKAEQLRHVTNIDENKEKEYLQRQEKLVNRLEQLYSKSIQNVGAGHKNACEVNEREIPETIDLSKLRGKEAAAVLKQKKQDKLDEQKKLLDRKLKARQVANVLSREKIATVTNTLIKSSCGKGINNGVNDNVSHLNDKVSNDTIETLKDKSDPITKNDMGTQWEFEEIPNEWEPNIPTLPIPNDDSIKNSADDNLERSDRTQKHRRINLFALSDEMPSSLRGGVTNIPDDRLPIKPSLTLVSEYLQNRGLRLRESDTAHVQKKNSDDLQSIKQTLLKTRASRTNGSVFSNICHVLDEQVIPVPCWRAERNCEFCSHINEHIPQQYENRQNNNNSFNKTLISKPGFQHLFLNSDKPKPYPNYHKCHRGLKIPVSGKSNNIEHSCNKLSEGDNNRTLGKKQSVTMYDHNTKDTRDLPHNIDRLVVRDQSIDDDAYSQAIKEASVPDISEKPHQTLQQEARNRLAITRENVDKEFRDTLAFLNTIPKEKPIRSTRTAYMDGHREKELKDKRQQKLQQEYKKIEKQSSKHHCKHARNKLSSRGHIRSRSKSPITNDTDNNMTNRDFQYSWLPIPESDDSMAIHTIPNTVKHNKPGNTVKFSSVDTYHEYRSRHKHTPPTKDIDDEPKKRVMEAVIIQENSNDSINSSETDTSSVDNLQVGQDSITSHKVNKDKHLPDAERIIIYKVMESKRTKKQKMKRKTLNGNNIDKNCNFDDKTNGVEHPNAESVKTLNVPDKIQADTVSFTQLKEGIYKSVSAIGLSYNIMSCCTDVDMWQTSSDRMSWWDNIASLYLADDQQELTCSQDAKSGFIGKEDNTGTVGSKNLDNDIDRNRKPCDNCKTTDSQKCTDKSPSVATSTSSFKTAVNDKANNVLQNSGYIKFVDEGVKDSGKFYVGASGFLKDDAYEVVIQLRKKEAEKNIDIYKDKNNIDIRTSSEKNVEENNLIHKSATTQLVKEGIDSSQNLYDSENQKTLRQENPNLECTKNNIASEQTPISDKIDGPENINAACSKQGSPTEDTPEISNKGISTTFRDAFAIPDNMPKLEETSKPVNSISTQTNQNSSIPKPALMHLSSSTSTTYMSPPELILPTCLRKGTSESCDDTYEPVSRNFDPQRFTDYKECCKCRKCKKREKRAKADTPPNTTRSTDKTTDNFANKEQHKKSTTSENWDKNLKTHKCKSRSDSKICSKQRFKRSPSESKRFHSGSNYSALSNKKSRMSNSFDKDNINPVIKTYVKKLLALNKEGLKAIEVVNQECTAVNTPGSSIIDVPSNISNKRTTLCNKISLEQIKNSLEQQILENIIKRKNISNSTVRSTGSQTERNTKLLHKFNKKRSVHKVKSFNLSKHLIKISKESRRQSVPSSVTTSPCSVYSKKERVKHFCTNIENNNRQSDNSVTPRQMNINQESSNNVSNSEISKDPRKIVPSGNKSKSNKKNIKLITSNNTYYQSQAEKRSKSASYPFPPNKATMKSHSSESEASNDIRNHRNLSTPPISTSTQTNQVDSEVEFMKLAENKLQNMEKIADLTEKCTKRLSNLAKVLEEVRRHKALAYSQISTSDCTSESDQRSDKNIQINENRTKTFNPTVEIQTLTEALSSMPTSPQEQRNHDANNIQAYVPILMDLPKPNTFKTPAPQSILTETNKADVHIVLEQQVAKNRGKPPPALTRINLKHVAEGFIIPHELSTVVEVDSPMSIKMKSHATQIDNKNEVTDTEVVDNIHINKLNDGHFALDSSNKLVDYNDLFSKFNLSKRRRETQPTETLGNSKIKMMDLEHFNEIMLKPFITLKDYAKKYNLEELDGQTSLNGISKNENPNEELSSLHSETSIPDVMAELLKRNLISEPFKFETTSNVNSTTVSSESTLSLLALSKARKEKKKSALLLKNKENIAETSVSLSISSNPDLEHAFQRLGMGWASSTLKKTKERLALSSSSNTSSSSMPQFKIKSFSYQDAPELSSLNNSKREEFKSKMGNCSETSKNALQQTSLTNSMTVKEFLTNELADKITFSNKTNRHITEDEFISLCETRLPEEMKHWSHKSEINEKSVESIPSVINNRARTSTPVQIYKSMTYHSTSSSNTSNGLFSNADDLSSVKGTSHSNKNHSTSDKDDLTIPNYSLKMRNEMTERSKSD